MKLPSNFFTLRASKEDSNVDSGDTCTTTCLSLQLQPNPLMPSIQKPYLSLGLFPRMTPLLPINNIVIIYNSLSPKHYIRELSKVHKYLSMQQNAQN